ncbi:MAG: ASCH domain-containing protein [Acidobacteriota bacterium]
MLIRKPILERIKSGEVTLAFRRWKRPTVKTGGTLKTAVGLLSVDRVEPTVLESITEASARKAGYPSLEKLLAELKSRDGETYRIELSYAGEDPRLALRENADLTPEELAAVASRLSSMDSRSKVGPWTRDVLATIDRHPKTAAAGLAARTGFEKDWLKTHVRKLKNLGLTISHHPGYELSPRGSAMLNHLRRSHPEES